MKASPEPPEREETLLPCDSCGAPSTHDVLDPGDAAVGIAGGWVALCDDCDPAVRIERNAVLQKKGAQRAFFQQLRERKLK